MKPQASLLISSHNRLPLFRRTLWSIAKRPPSIPFEVVVVDDNSTEDILGELKPYSSRFAWKLIRFDAAEFEAKTGLRKQWNNPCATNNLAFNFAEGDLIFQQGNEIIAWADVYDKLISDIPRAEHWMVLASCFDMPRQHLDKLDQYGTNLNEKLVEECARWPLQAPYWQANVTNYIGLAPRSLWEKLGGYDERYYEGIACEDSDFVRRARALPDFKLVFSEGLSLHQFHFGKSRFYEPPAKVITKQRWDELVAVNRAIYDSWQGQPENQQRWPWGTFGVKEVISNV